MKLKSLLVLATIAPALLTGCAMITNSAPKSKTEVINDQKAEIETLQIQQAAMQEELMTWKEMKPSVEQLIEVEGELNMLIQKFKELDDTAASNNTNVTSQASGNFYMLQLASLGNRAEVEPTWMTQQQLHPEILKGLPARFQPIEMNGKQYYRLKVGEFKQKADALQTCQQLIAKNTNCIVVNNKGFSL